MDEKKINFVTAQEIAERLNVPLTWVYERTRNGKIPHRKMGKYLRYDLAEVLGCFPTQTKQTDSPFQ